MQSCILLLLPLEFSDVLYEYFQILFHQLMFHFQLSQHRKGLYNKLFGKLITGAFFNKGSPEISLAGSVLGSIWGSKKVKEGPSSPGRVSQ